MTTNVEWMQRALKRGEDAVHHLRYALQVGGPTRAELYHVASQFEAAYQHILDAQIELDSVDAA